MAACKIDIIGIGSVLIRYKLSGVNKVIPAGVGDLLYVDTTATNVTYTNISGTAIATSSCINISNLPLNCRKFSWTFSKNCINCIGLYNDAITTYKFKYLSYNTIENTITPVNINLINPLSLAKQINMLGLQDVKATAYKVTETQGEYIIELIMQVYGNILPEIIAESVVGNNRLYFKSVISECLPNDFTIIDVC